MNLMAPEICVAMPKNHKDETFHVSAQLKVNHSYNKTDNKKQGGSVMQEKIRAGL